MRVNLAIFHRVLKTPCFRQSLYISSIKPGQALCAAFSASAGMLSGPGAFLFLSDSTACESSLSVKSGISLGGTVILVSIFLGEWGTVHSPHPPCRRVHSDVSQASEFFHNDFIAEAPRIVVYFQIQLSISFTVHCHLQILLF